MDKKSFDNTINSMSGGPKRDDVPLVDSDGIYKLYRIDNIEQATSCTKGTWCISMPHVFDGYGAPFYMVTRGKHKYSLMHQKSGIAVSKYDKALTLEEAEPIKDWILKIWPEFQGSTNKVGLDGIKELWADSENTEIEEY